jgi:NAD-dependent dihydropyrimidine dehydrogenase PreA subunit
VHQSLLRSFMTYVITEPCVKVKDATCIEVCPVDCIHPRKEEKAFAKAPQLYIDPDVCIDCGACVPVCPVKAIFREAEVPKKWKHYAQINSDYFKR